MSKQADDKNLGAELREGVKSRSAQEFALRGLVETWRAQNAQLWHDMGLDWVSTSAVGHLVAVLGRAAAELAPDDRGEVRYCEVVTRSGQCAGFCARSPVGVFATGSTPAEAFLSLGALLEERAGVAMFSSDPVSWGIAIWWGKILAAQAKEG